MVITIFVGNFLNTIDRFTKNLFLKTSTNNLDIEKITASSYAQKLGLVESVAEQEVPGMEVYAARTLNSKTFKKGDKLIARIYQNPIHYTDKEGKLLDIENNLVASQKQGYVWENESNSYKSFFSLNTSHKELVQLEKEKYNVSWNLKGAKKGIIGETNKNKIIYPKIIENVDLRYTVNNDSLKEDLIFKSAQIPSEFIFNLNLGNLIFSNEQDGTIVLKDSQNGKEIFTIEKPYMYDMSGARTENIKFNIYRENNEVFIKIVPDQDWIKSKDRQFPIVLDPSYKMFQPDGGTGRDSWVGSLIPYQNQKSNKYLNVGYISGYGRTRSYDVFTEFNSYVPYGSRVDNAEYLLYDTRGQAYKNIDVYEVTSNWDWDNPTLTWNHQPSSGELITRVGASNGDWWHFPVTRLAQKWADGMVNNGMRIQLANEYESYRDFWSCDYWTAGVRPRLDVYYTPDYYPPSGSININGGSEISPSRNVTLNLWASDDISGTNVSMSFCNEDGNWTGWEPFSYTKNWTLTSVDGIKTVNVRYMDRIGRVSYYSDSILLDTSPPLVGNLTAPYMGFQTANRTLTFNWTPASDATGVDHYLLVASLVNDGFATPVNYVLWNTLGANISQYTQTFTTDLKDIYWTVYAYDRFGHVSKYATGYINNIDTSPPTLPSLTINPFTPGLQNQVTWTTSTDSGVNGVSYEVQKSTSSNFETVQSSGWITGTSYTFTGLTDGYKYYYKVRAKDGLGNTSGWSDISYSTQDNTSPVISIFSINRGIFSPGINNAAVNALILETNFNNWDITVKKGNSIVRTATGTGTRTEAYFRAYWSWDGKDNNGVFVNEGTYIITLKAIDKAGNSVSRDTSIIVDKTKPIINLSQPAPGAITNQRTYKVQGTFNDNNLPLSSIIINGVQFNPLPNNVFEGDVSLIEGTNLITVQLTDRAGNVTTETREILMDETPPTVYNQNPANGQSVGTAQPNIKADYMDLSSGINVKELRFYLDGIDVTDQSQISGSGVTFFPQNGLNKGTHNVKVQIADIAGNIQSSSWDFNVDLDTFVSISQPVEKIITNKSITEVAGLTEKGNTLKLSVNDKEIATLTNVDEKYSFKDVQLNEGSNNIKVEATDLFNHVSSSEVHVTLDTKNPAVSIDASPKFISPNGDGQQDIAVFQLSAEGTGSQIKDWSFIINNSTGATVRTYSDLGAPPSLMEWDGKDQSGQLLNDGKYSYKLLIHDFAGNESVTQEKELIIDTIAPAIPSIQKPPTDIYSNQSTIMNGGVAEARAAVTIYNKNVKIDVVAADDAGNWSYLIPLNSGANTINANATDMAGNESGFSNTVNITVTTIPPIKQVEATPLLGSEGKIVTLKATTTSITKNVQALTPDGKVITLTTSDLTNWTGYWVVGNSVAEGVAVLNFSAEDWAGNKGSGAVSVIIDNTPPQVPVIRSPIGQIDTNKDDFTFIGEGEPYAKIILYSRLGDKNTQLGEATVAANGQWNLDNIKLAEGENQIWAVSVDPAQNSSGNSDTVTLRVDRTVPVFTGQIDPLYIPVGHTLSFSAQTSIDTTQVLAVMPDGAIGYLNKGIMGWQGSITVGTSIADGNYEVIFYAYDAAGNKGTYKAKLIVDSTPPDAPQINKPITDEFTNIVNYEAVGTAEAGSTVTLYYWDNESMKSKTQVATDGAWKIQIPLLEGQNSIYATSTDLAGNISVRSEQINFTLDTIPPEAPTINKPINNFLTNVPEQVISGNGEPYATITLYHNGNIVDYPVVSPQGDWTSKKITFTEGINKLQAKATDRAINTGPMSAETIATLDTIPPEPPVQWAKINRLNQFITVYGTAEPNSTATVYINNNKLGTTQVDAQGNWQYKNVDIEAGKIYTITSTATDAATNVSKVSNPSRILRYYVISGDDLWGIAGFYYGDGNRINDIKQYNDLVDNKIYHGWNLLIPEPVKDGIYSTWRIEQENILKEQQRQASLGKRNNCPTGIDPVNTSLGNYIYGNTDIKLAGGKGIPLEITRGYNSLDYYHGPFGYGWNFNYNIKLNFYQLDGKDYVEVLNYDGRRDLFTKNADGTYQSPLGIFDSLTEAKDGSFIWETKDKVKYYFSDFGRLTSSLIEMEIPINLSTMNRDYW